MVVRSAIGCGSTSTLWDYYSCRCCCSSTRTQQLRWVLFGVAVISWTCVTLAFYMDLLDSSTGSMGGGIGIIPTDAQQQQANEQMRRRAIQFQKMKEQGARQVQPKEKHNLHQNYDTHQSKQRRKRMATVIRAGHFEANSTTFN